MQKSKRWIFGVVGIFMGIAAATMPLAYPDTSIWVWRLFFWSSVLLISICIGIFLYEYVSKSEWAKPIIKNIEESRRLLIVTLMIGATIGIVATCLFYNYIHDVTITPKQIASNVRNWLEEYDYSIRVVPNTKEHFRFDIESKMGKQTTISLSKLHKTYLFFQVEIIPDKKDREEINKLSSKKLTELVMSIKNSLAEQRLGYDVQSSLKPIEFDEELFIEELTKANFFKVLRRLNTGQAMVASHFYNFLVMKF